MTRIVALFAAAAVLLGLALGFFLVLRGQGDDRFADCRRSAVAGGAAAIGGPFSLTAPDGRRVTDADVITGPTLVYFGYAFCPDFCPTDLARNADVADLLAARGQNVGLVFVSIDPERDTPQTVGTFAANIHPDLVALTGTPDEVAAAAAAYRVYFRKADDDPEYYLVDHSTFTYLMAPGEGFLEFFPSSVSAEDMADSVGCFITRL
jgi:protein SCO1/2